MTRSRLKSIQSAIRGAGTFCKAFIKNLPRMYASFLYYWNTERIASVFILYSLGFAIVLSWMAAYVANFGLIVRVAGVYMISTIPFFFWISQKFDEGELDPEQIQ